MSEALDIDSDWKKARAFLVTFSVVVLLAWYFSADVNNISILGLSLKPKENANDIWGAIAILNVYFLARYYQKLPDEHKKPADRNHATYEKTLINIYIKNNRKALRKITEDKISTDHEQRKSLTIRPYGKMEYRENYASPQSQDDDSPIESYRSHSKNRITFSIWYSYKTDTSDLAGYHGAYLHGLTMTPSKTEVLTAQVLAWFKNCLFNSWGSDYIFPFLLGFSGSMIATSSWIAARVI